MIVIYIIKKYNNITMLNLQYKEQNDGDSCIENNSEIN